MRSTIVKRFVRAGSVGVCCLVACGCAILPSAMRGDRDVIAQVSTIDALLNGVYDGQMSCGELLQRGDLGIGTFEGLDGEMVVLDGRVYHVGMDGSVKRMADKELTPFATVTWFDEDIAFDLSGGDYQAFQESVKAKLPSENLLYAIQVEGTFAYMKTRSVPRQSKPYPPLAEIVKKQAVFEMENVEGKLVGFWCPSFVKGINVVGFHVHFMRADGQAGGHVLDFRLVEGRVAIDVSREMLVTLPGEGDFLATDLTKDMGEELHAVEKDR